MAPNLKIITLRENKSYSWQTFVKSHKMLIGLLARRWCKSPKPLVYDKSAGKKLWFLIRIKDCWLCMISHPLLSSMCNLGYKSPVENKALGLAHQSLVSPCHSFPQFPAESPSGARRSPATIYLPGLLRPTREGVWGGAPSAIWEGACGLRGQS